MFPKTSHFQQQKTAKFCMFERLQVCSQVSYLHSKKSHRLTWQCFWRRNHFNQLNVFLSGLILLVSLAIADIQLIFILYCFKAVFRHLLAWKVPKTLLKPSEMRWWESVWWQVKTRKSVFCSQVQQNHTSFLVHIAEEQSLNRLFVVFWSQLNDQPGHCWYSVFANFWWF